jgi:hypothetical protein
MIVSLCLFTYNLIKQLQLGYPVQANGVRARMSFPLNSSILTCSFSGALALQARPIQFDLCIWGQAEVWTWGARVVRFRASVLEDCSKF